MIQIILQNNLDREALQIDLDTEVSQNDYSSDMDVLMNYKCLHESIIFRY